MADCDARLFDLIAPIARDEFLLYLTLRRDYAPKNTKVESR